MLTPALVFIGVCSNIASDAGSVVLPPLAAGMFAMVGRSPLVAIAAVTFGVAGGFSANLLVSSLDPLLLSLTKGAARALDPAGGGAADLQLLVHDGLDAVPDPGGMVGDREGGGAALRDA
jgi:p-aminobenzoyl-glutamate transporter AbgT